jgi:hypothetical protein
MVGPGAWSFHAHPPDPVEHTQGSQLHVVSATPGRWRFNLIRRTDLVRTSNGGFGPAPSSAPAL